jgi:hypothetical protein
MNAFGLPVPDFSVRLSHKNFSNMKRGGWSVTRPSPLYNLIINNNKFGSYIIIINIHYQPRRAIEAAAQFGHKRNHILVGV